MQRSNSVRLVAALEAFKGTLALAAGAGVLSLMNRDVESIGERLARHLHLNPAKNHERVFLDALSHLDDARLMLVAIGAAAYATVRLLLAVGLWRGKPWAAWLAVVGDAIYIPFEIYALARHVTPLNVGTFLANVLVLVVLVNAVRKQQMDGAVPERSNA